MIKLWKDLLSYLPGIWQHRWWGLWTALVVGVAGVVVAMVLPNQYEATARVQLDTQSILKPLMDGLAVQPNADQQVQMMARTLVSRPNVERVVTMAGIDVPKSDANGHDKLVLDLMRDIHFRPSGGSNFYSVAYRNPDPAVARKVVESLLKIFNETNLGDKRRDGAEARKFIDEQLAVYEKKLVDAENALKDFKVRNLSLMPNLASDYVAQTTDAQKQLAEAKLQLRQLESSRGALQAQLAGEKPTFESTLGGIDAPLAGMPASGPESRLDAARKQLDALLVRFTDDHPDVIALRRSIKEMEAQQAADKAAGRPDSTRQTVIVPNKVYQDIKIQLADTEAKIAALRAKVAEAQDWLADARKAAATIPKVEAEYTQLTRDYDVNKKSYDQLLQRREAADISSSMGSSSGIGAFRVIDPPYVDRRPASPNRPMLLIAVLMASLAAGLAMTFFRDALSPTFRDARSLREETGLPLLGSVAMNVDRRGRAAVRRGAFVFSTSAVLYLAVFVALIGYQTLMYLRA